MHLVGLEIIGIKAIMNLYQIDRLHLGFVVDLAEGLLKVPTTRWEAHRVVADDILGSKGVRAQARKLASLVGTVISMKLTWGPITQLYTRDLYHILNNIVSLNCRVTVGDDEALNEPFF